jgi:hypothetical protein
MLIGIFQKEIIIPCWQITLYILGALGTVIPAIIFFVLGITGNKI